MNLAKNETTIIRTRGKISILETSSIHVSRTHFYSDGTTENVNIDYPLEEISEKDLVEKRLSGNSGFCLKRGQKCYYAEVPRRMNFLTKRNFGLGNHLCANCNRLSPLSDEEGGCQKVRDCSSSLLKRYGFSLTEAVWNCSRIEKYDFITYGFENFNMPVEAFVVLQCENFEKQEHNKPKIQSRDELDKMKLCLMQYVVPQARTIDEARKLLTTR